MHVLKKELDCSKIIKRLQLFCKFQSALRNDSILYNSNVILVSIGVFNVANLRQN